MASLSLLLLLVFQVFAAQRPEKATIADLKFIAGRWHGVDGQAKVDEQWSEPEGDNMMGMFRVVRNGAVSIYEMMCIEQTAEGVMLRLKQFKFGLETSKEKPDVINFRLSSVKPNEAVFRKVNGDSQIIFHRTGKDSMIASVVIKGEKLDYVYSRRKD